MDRPERAETRRVHEGHVAEIDRDGLPWINEHRHVLLQRFTRREIELAGHDDARSVSVIDDVNEETIRKKGLTTRTHPIDPHDQSIALLPEESTGRIQPKRV